MRIAKWRIAQTVLLAAGLAGIGTGLLPSPALAGSGAPPPPRFPSGKPSAAQLVAYLNDNARRVQAIECQETALDVRDGHYSTGLDCTLVCQKPRNFRLQAKLLGQPGVDIGSNSNECWYWISKDNPPYLYYCPYRDLARVRVLRPFFYPDLIVAALGMAEHDPNSKYEVKESPRYLELIEPGMSPWGEPVQKVTVFHRAVVAPGWPQVRAHLFRDSHGDLICKATIQEIQVNHETGAVVPKKLTLAWPTERITVQLVCDSLTVNPPLKGAHGERLFTRPADKEALNLGNGPAARPEHAARREREKGKPAVGHARGAEAHPEEGAVLQRFLRSRRIRLRYEVREVGPSGVDKVELWVTRDGRTWRKCSDRLDLRGPFVFEADGEGRYGFTLVVSSGTGLAGRPPHPGDPPQIWVEVDLTPPAVSLRGVRVGQGADADKLFITWSATDRNLGPRPIKLSWAETPEGPWTLIAENVPNIGHYPWRLPPRTPCRLWVRVEAADRAGNLAVTQTAKPVVVDRARPRGVILDAEAATEVEDHPRSSAPAPVGSVLVPEPKHHDFGLKVEIVGSTPGQSGERLLAEGQKLEFRIEVQRDAYVGVWSIGSDGLIQQIFPDDFESDPLVRAGQPRTVPGGAAAEDYTLRAAYSGGREWVWAVASTERWKAPEGERAGPYPIFRTKEQKRAILLVPTAKKAKVAVAEQVLPYRVQRSGPGGK